MAKFVWSVNRRERALFLRSPPTTTLVAIGDSKIYCQKLPTIHSSLADLDARSRSAIVNRANEKKCAIVEACDWVEEHHRAANWEVSSPQRESRVMTSLAATDHVSRALSQPRRHIAQDGRYFDSRSNILSP